MSKKNLISKISYLVFFIIILIIFGKILINANHLQLKITNNFVPKLYHAKYEPIKIVPEHNINLTLDKNEKIYEFINNKEWHFKPKVNTQQNKKTKKEIQYDKKVNAQEKNKKSVLNYKKHNIHIIKPESKNLQKQADVSRVSIQLGAFTTHNKALIEKERLKKALAKIIEPYNFIIEKSQIKQKSIIYRLKIIPFSNVSNAKKFCNNLRKKGVGCFLSS
jgi:hypothetical protein